MTTQDAAAQHGSSIDSRLGCSTASAITSRMSTSPTPCRSTSICPSATGGSTSPAGSRRWPTPGYAGHFTLELETRDITNDQRPAATARAAQLISGLI
jgi:hypothetical protein